MSTEVLLGPLPMRDATLSVASLIEHYMSQYQGRDCTRAQRLAWWTAQLGAVPLGEVSDDDVHAGLQALQAQKARVYAGLDAEGKPVFRARKKPLTGATINRYLAALAAVFTWAIRRRVAPKGFVHPVQAIERSSEPPGKTRFLSPDERERLLAACKASKWPRLYLFALLALTTGARRGELLTLRWRDVDLSRKVIHIERTKNEDKKVLPLVPAVHVELMRFEGAADALVFPGRLRPAEPYVLDDRWRQALRAAKIRDFRIHDLRHTTASYLAQSGATPIQIADLLGHRTMAMVQRYSHLNAGHRAELVDRVMGHMA